MVKRVAIVQRIITNYRSPILQALAGRLSANGIALKVFGGNSLPGEGFEDGLGDIDVGSRVRNHYLHGKIYWQNILGTIRDYDLVIVEQALSALLNYPLLVGRHLLSRPHRIGFWGHGATLNQRENIAIKLFKRKITTAVDHWFAYTTLSARIVANIGFPEERITVLNNSVDVTEISEAEMEVRQIGRPAARARIGLENAFTAVFCARLTAGKKLDFLLEAAAKAKTNCPDLQLVVIGDGPERDRLTEFAKTRPWIRTVGALYGKKKARYLAASDVMLLPSWVGLSILDGFAAGLPVLAADFGNHSPEIAYLEDGINGYLSPASAENYADALCLLFEHPDLRRKLSNAALQSSSRYSLSNMIEHFAGGIMTSLDIDGGWS